MPNEKCVFAAMVLACRHAASIRGAVELEWKEKKLGVR